MYANEIYVTLDDPLNKEEVLDHFNKTFDFAKSQMGSAQEIALRLTPLKEVYYTHDTTFDFNPKGHRETNILRRNQFYQSHNLVDSTTIENDQYAPGIRMLHL